MNRLIATVAVMLVLGLVIGTAARSAAEASPRGAAQAQAGCLDAQLAEIEGSGISGMAQVCVDEIGVHGSIEARELTAGEAYTVWFVYFDQPTTCAATPCGPPDMLGDDPPGVFTRMDGLIADDASETEFTGDFRDLRLSDGSAVHLVIFAHGSASTTDNRMLARQLLTPQRTALGAPGMGTVADGDVGYPVAAAEFGIPDGGI